MLLRTIQKILFILFIFYSNVVRGEPDCSSPVASLITISSACEIPSSGLTITNTGTLNAGSIYLINDGLSSGSFTNNGLVNLSSSYAMLLDQGSFNFTNTGIINATANYVIWINGATIGTFLNSGTIDGSTSGYPLRFTSGSIGTFTNSGSISYVFSTILLDGSLTIGTLNNAQGASSSALKFSASSKTLPTNYNIIINSLSDFGRLDWTSPSGSTTFGIYSGSTVAAGRYTSVITGLSAGSFTGARSGTYGSYSWVLDNVSGTTWDLVLSLAGPSAADTQSSLARLASNLRGSFNSASLISNFSNTYDCNLFDVKGMCISAGGRYSTVDNPSSNSSAAVVTLGYKVSPNIRIGGFLDQSVNNNSPAGIDISNKHPMMGAFAYWNQNADGLGYQVKVANAYLDKDLSTIRDVIGTSEAGRGNTSLNSRSYVSELSYAFMYKENTLVRPYFALRHTSIEQDAYTETGVTTPLTYSALNDRTTSALMGVKFKHALTPKANLIGSLGVEQDLNNKTDRLTASGVSGLTSENFSGNIDRTRPVASLGATYDIAKAQRLSGEVLVQQLPFQSTAGATAYVNYMIGF
jgi:hypothetical protein